MGRFFSSLDHRRERPARTNQKRKDTRTGFDGKTRGAGEINRVHHGIHREADITRQLDYNLPRALEGLLRREVWAVVEEDEGNLQCLFAKHVLPIVGNQPPREVTLTSLQLLLNKMADCGYRKSAVGQVRTYLKSCFEYAADEDVIQKSPARKLAMPNIQKKSCERFLSLDEFRALLSHASPREHLVLRILGVCGLRPAEVLVLRIEDFEGSQLRIDEALKERQKGDARIGDTKTDESDNFVPVPPDLEREIKAWIAGHPDRNDARAFLFPSSSGTAFSVGNYLKRYLKPLAETAGVRDVTHQAFRRTSSTHMQNHATVKDMQRHLRHTDPQTTLKHYAKVIPTSLRAAVAALDAQITGTPVKSK